MCGYLIAIGMVSLLNAGLSVGLASLFGATEPNILVAVAVCTWVLTVIVMLFVGEAKGENDG